MKDTTNNADRSIRGRGGAHEGHQNKADRVAVGGGVLPMKDTKTNADGGNFRVRGGAHDGHQKQS
jgi:hypothetical protein